MTGKSAPYPRLESQLLKQLVGIIKSDYPSAWMLKVHGDGYQRIGTPDLLLCIEGRLLAIEVKHRKPGESIDHMLSRVSALQWHQIELLRAAGATAEVVWDSEGLRALLESFSP